ncbi:hypothetical protein [Novacetimonas hansenii]|uniref:hypothetical protein n=1 Tax=Novacetimonas hansenii TaxID=436 RepID=UPI00079230E4|nr:hypothetical protein [Novacetimonas hansenii]RFO99740.1 hypothetical protein BGC30_10280 [Novacetimonas hansenii]WEQ58289.1 hypothetical protein LV563_10510 [Novacetimonas hansenii]CUW48567.1 hypothetical protein ATCC53582_02706 [Novacetimonas hansenii]
MSKMVISVRDTEGETNFEEFRKLLREHGIPDRFKIDQIPEPVFYYLPQFIDYIVENGLQSIYNISTSSEYIISQSMEISNVESIVSRYVEHLNGSKTIMIVDPYLYANSKQIDTVGMFSKLLQKASSCLERVVFVTNGQKTDNKTSMHSAVRSLVPNCRMVDYSSDDIHDRFWIGVDTGKGIVMGTSLNGLGRKIALVDKLQDYDVSSIINLARDSGITV